MSWCRSQDNHGGRKGGDARAIPEFQPTTKETHLYPRSSSMSVGIPYAFMPPLCICAAGYKANHGAASCGLLGRFRQTDGGDGRCDGRRLHRAFSASRSRSRNVGLLAFAAVAAASSVKRNSSSSAVYRSSGVDHSSEALENNAEPKEGRFVFTVDSFVKKVSVVITGCRGTVIPASRRLEI